MKRHIAHITLIVADYDEAIDFYTQKLDFVLIEDTILNESKRWVLIAPNLDAQCCILLAKAVGEEQQLAIGNQSGKRVFLFLYTDDFWHDHEAMTAKGIHFVRPPVTEDYGIVAVFEDLYGNLWDLIQPVEKIKNNMKPTITIEYCPKCNWMMRAAYMAQELLTTFTDDVYGVTLHPSQTSGKYTISVNDEVLFDRKEQGRFPEIKELKQLVRDKVNPDKSLGHSER